LLGFLPAKFSQKIFLTFSGEEDHPRIAFEHAGTWVALEAMYTYSPKEATPITRFWETVLDNARAIRNRLALVRKELFAAIVVNDEEKEIRVLSVGSGSARAVIETIAALSEQYRSRIKVLLIDMDATAIEFSEVLAKQYGINHTTKRTGNFFRLERDAANFCPNIIELVGLLDYLSDRQVVVLLQKVHNVLSLNGYLLTSNIAPNLEAMFVTKAINWPMTYRTPDKLEKLLKQAGFRDIQIRKEPLGVYTVAVARKFA